ncbi:MAG: hypothetical protein B6U95_00295 [Thermofilum sp. ex4484_82]|nr:MAG: hypothetical protein B6U95_00295 [Thermofilum sp. ex4484_82]OYT40054.1 MAG: hypothetical protein B6U96_00295 [Archaeoglobales archaeon ex4484_92]
MKKIIVTLYFSCFESYKICAQLLYIIEKTFEISEDEKGIVFDENGGISVNYVIDSSNEVILRDIVQHTPIGKFCKFTIY